jgi:hypothetical protein
MIDKASDARSNGLESKVFRDAVVVLADKDMLYAEEFEKPESTSESSKES